jgi:hypothetical protein
VAGDELTVNAVSRWACTNLPVKAAACDSSVSGTPIAGMRAPGAHGIPHGLPGEMRAVGRTTSSPACAQNHVVDPARPPPTTSTCVDRGGGEEGIV